MAERSLNRILFVTDSHFGWERVDGVTRPIHDLKAHNITLTIAADFKPTYIIYGGDGLDGGAVAHHNNGKARLTEGLRLVQDAQEFRQRFLEPLEKAHPKAVKRYHKGNHERFIDDVIDGLPGLEGAISFDSLLALTANGWQTKGLGQVSTIGGKLHFLHGDSIKGGQFPSKWAVEAYQRSMMFGHFHTQQRWTKHNALDATDIHRGFAVGCLCRRDPGYGRGTPNKWSQSIAVIEEDPKSGAFQVEEVDIFAGKAIWQGRCYRG